MELLQALDTRLYLALATSGNPVAAVFGLFFAAFAFKGIGWWGIALLGVRARGLGRRGLRIAFVVAVGGLSAAQIAEWLKVIVQRPRPFDLLRVEALIQPSSLSFPSGDAALAFGAATGLWLTWPAARIPAVLVAVAIGLSRVVVGAHYPSDVVAGAVVGVLCGIAAERLWSRLLRGD